MSVNSSSKPVVSFGKMIEFLLNNNVYVVVAGVLAAGSFLLLNWGNNENAKKTQEEITTATDEIIKEAVQNATTQTVSKLATSTETLIAQSESAVKDITDYTTQIKEQINDELRIIETATKKLENLTENQEILVQVEYVFVYDTEAHVSEREDIYADMQFELTTNNFYKLKLISDEHHSEFASENNSFQIFDQRLDGGTNIEETFINGWSYREMANVEYPQKFRVNYLLDAHRIGFVLNDMDKGDKIVFSIRKRTSEGNNSVKKKWSIKKSPYVTGFSNLVQKDPDSWPKGRLDLKIKLRNGRTFVCKSTFTFFLGEQPDYGFYNEAEIVDIMEP
nr:hypothetical protein [Allomuricauda sp.]